MTKSKYIGIIACIAVLAAIVGVGLALDNKSEETAATVIQTSVQTVTDKQGEAVTDKSGNVLTEVVTVVEEVSEEASSEAGSEASATTENKSEKPDVEVKSEGTEKAKETTKTGKKTTTKKKNKNKKETTTEPEIVYIDIVLQKNRTAKCSSPNVSIATGEVTIEKEGNYRITQNTGGKDWYGKIVVKLKNTEKAELRFENVKLSNNTSNIIQLIDKSITTSRSFLESEGAAAEDEIKVVSDFDLAPNVQLSFPEGTSSSFVTTANSVTGVLYNESKLTIKGHGKATFESQKNANNCICSTKSIKIRNVNLNLITAQNTNTSTLAANTGAARGIYSYSKVTLESGTLNVKTNGDGIRCDEFISESGTANISSSACDGIDADDAIVINGGTITSIALEKYSFKVRRINNTEKGETDKGVRSGKGDTFSINGGIVRGESKKITTVQKASKQPSITCKIVKPSRGTDKALEESKVPAIITIKDVKSSSNKCTKFLYSVSGITKNKEYTATANGNSAKCKWNGSVGIIDIDSITNR